MLRGNALRILSCVDTVVYLRNRWCVDALLRTEAGGFVKQPAASLLPLLCRQVPQV